MRSEFDFAPFRRSSVGFDRLFDMMETSAAGQSQDNYPPFDLIRLLDITAQQNVLIVAGKKQDDDGSNFIHRGIATRSFERRFTLADHVQVRDADLREGLLSIKLVREIPEAMKPRKIDVGRSADQRQEQSAIGGDWKVASKQTVNADAHSE
jgi:molecular chaperone IbpA